MKANVVQNLDFHDTVFPSRFSPNLANWKIPFYMAVQKWGERLFSFVPRGEDIFHAFGLPAVNDDPFSSGTLWRLIYTAIGPRMVSLPVTVQLLLYYIIAITYYYILCTLLRILRINYIL